LIPLDFLMITIIAAIEFGDMLKETLDKMSEKIEATSNEWDHDAGGDVQKKLEEFNIGPIGM